MNNRLFTSLIMIVAVIAHAMATVTFSAHAPRQVNQGSNFQISYELRDAEGSGFTAPEVDGADKLYGPAVSSSYSSSWVNGKSSTSTSQEYTMTYRAKTPGTYKVGAATITVGGQKMTTKPFTIEILPSGEKADNSRQNNSTAYNNPMTQSAGKKVDANDLFVRIIMSKQHIYEQEAVVCTIRLYTKYQISQFMPTLQPSFDGFLIEELPQSPNLNNVETYNGERYMVADLKKCILYPQQSGKLTIASGNYDVTVVQYDTYRSLFGTLSQPVERKLQVKSNSATVDIAPLPEPKPASFSGAVGKFSLSANITPEQLKTYAAATYSLVISGTGNLKYIKAPSVTFPKQFDVYDPQNSTNAKAQGGNMTGSTTVNYTFIPQFAGKFTIPAVEFSYFDPSTRRYETLRSRSFSFDVAKGAGAPSTHYQTQTTDIRHIAKRVGKLTHKPSFLVDSVWYWLIFIVPTLLFSIALVVYRKKLKERADVARMRTKRASKVAQKRLKQARKFMNTGESNAFYSEVLKALWGYLSDKLGIPVSELNRDNINAELENYGVSEEGRTAVIAALDKCEFAQYAPELANDNLSEVHDEVAAIMDGIERGKF